MQGFKQVLSEGCEFMASGLACRKRVESLLKAGLQA
jgi:hypothetical protein